MTERYNPPLQVLAVVGSRRGDVERGPQVRLCAEDARMRSLLPGELVWVTGPRRKELAPVVVDDEVPRGGVIARDIAGITVTEIVRLVKVDLDRTFA